ncbi:hypothetical protein BU097_02485 [Staphylococcus xylosus]|uniref:Uncharacterized protein n=1 Tax=Staphylococcus xylosus TaxID=1288 RepID=A0A418IRE6_STAXY|nr:hypothetical protein [Staphylococcus xylosus]MRF37157.1 hypothetical protein [Staphylococcus sp. KY49P]PTI58834.1 hypothetical protein BU103_03370 [Staphylococcus xylosus]RIN12415.1 hypothetical protein BU097_02485 [Staphylococcus xylosus]
MSEETFKIKYTIEYERQYTFPAIVDEENEDIELRMSNHMFTNLDEYTSSELFKDIDEVRITDRGF